MLTCIHGPVWKMVNTWQKILLYYPIPKIGVFGFLIPWAIGKKQKKTKKLRFLAGLRWFCLAIHANLMSDGKKERLKIFVYNSINIVGKHII